MNYLLEAQYPNGGWPQFYPVRNRYWSHITFNDDAMIGVLETLRTGADAKSEYAFLNEADRARAKRAIRKRGRLHSEDGGDIERNTDGVVRAARRA